MKSRTENKNRILPENNYEEIADIRETIAQGNAIDGDEIFNEDSVIELDLKDFEEVGDFTGNKYLKSMTIIDEFENDLDYKNTLPAKFESSADSFNIEQLTIQIDSLTSVKKRKKIIMPVKPIVSKEEEKEIIKEIEPKKAENEIKQINKTEDIRKIEEIREIKEIREIAEPEKMIQEQEAGKREEKPEIRVEIKEIPELKSDIEQILQVTEKVKDLVEELKETKESRITPGETPKFEINEKILNTIIESKLGKLHEEIKEAKEAPREKAERQPGGNSITIEIPDKLALELPADFNLDELGKINLKEAEVIAEQDLLSFTGGELLKELERLNIVPEKAKESKEKIKTSAPEQTPVPVQKNGPGAEDLTEGKPVIIAEEKTLEPIKITAEKNETISETLLENKGEIQSAGLTAGVDTDVDIQFKQDEQGKIVTDENVFIIDNTSNKTDIQLKISGTDELENITSSAVDVIGGKPKQLVESETAERKSITGLIRDNYPTFNDLLKEKEIKDKHSYSDEDADFLDYSILTDNLTKKLPEIKDVADSTIKEKITSPHEQILGLVPDELEIIESQLFKRKADAPKTDPQKAGLDQHPSDTISLSKYKYILPVPDSLLDQEKKSIEDDISTESALIMEEDVAKIKKKLDDSSKKETVKSINDITDRITIYEEKNRKKIDNNDPKDKEEIKKLLGYLNELFEKLPEENIKNFADSEYYELYKKLL